MARELVGEGEFLEVFVDAPLEVVERRDPKGLYKKARAGEIKDFTGISSPYEPPEDPAVVLDTDKVPLEKCAELIVNMLREKGVVRVGASAPR
jgi:adenylylsulfate kinase-like enzyme